VPYVNRLANCLKSRAVTEEMSAPVARSGVRLSSELADKLVEAIAAGVPLATAACSRYR